MFDTPSYIAARDLLLDLAKPVETEAVSLFDCVGRVLAVDLVAADNIPAFDRSPYDGYAFRAEDTASASPDAPVTLKILEEIAAGSVPSKTVTAGTASKILTGAPVPEGADAVINYELTRFTDETVTLFAPVKEGSNIIRTGEDVRKGDRLAAAGTVIDAGTAGTLAAQGIAAPTVYRRARVAILSTGSELVEADALPGPGMIRNSNAYTLAAVLKENGMEPVYLGIAGDSVEAIAGLMERGLADCDAVISTGGVSVGDYDLTPAAMEHIGAEILVRGVDLKPGMACAYAVKQGKLLCGLSGNPASSLTNFYAVVLPALKKLAGRADATPEEIEVTLCSGFGKKSKGTRLLRGKLEVRGGVATLRLPKDQGNVVLSSSIGCDCFAIVPAGTGKLEPGTKLKGFLM